MNDYDCMFLEIAKNYVPNFNERRVCPDQYLGNVRVDSTRTSNPISNEAGSDFATRLDVRNFKRANLPIVILITESPHISEYSGEVRPVAGVGYGDAGRAIRDLFQEACDIHNYLTVGGYPLVVLNAIQYQCSLGDIKKFRDKVFIECWSVFGETNFKSRLRSLFKPGDIIINACTAGSTRKIKLRELVKTAIDEAVGPATLEIEHPCNWRRTHNTAIKNGVSPNYLWKTAKQA